MPGKRFIRAAAIAAAAVASTGAAHAAATLYGLTSAQSGRNLVSFNSETAGSFTSNIAITGDVDRSVDLFALDLNSSNNTLYALGSIGGGDYALYTIGYDGVARRVGVNLGLNIGTENAGLDYDAAANLFRLVTIDDRVFTVDPLTGLASAGQPIGYAPGAGAANPNVVAAAWNGDLYVLDRNGPGNVGLLSILDGGTLTAVAALDRQINANASFDIAANGDAFFNDGRVADRLYQLDLATGLTVDKGALELRLTGLTAAPGGGAAVPEPAGWAMMIGGFALVGFAIRRRSPRRLHA
ncbi:hypothetical protein GGR88_000433 [Sphingomonas jejuensis]|uniref:PEP-CTERM protein-sorting domain-containing protein n=1 Tax=Sphingomonas jejuensis TaxID=904715 RepID=A0ABX0XIA5_9SPHN|nr:DUF4394 domain-containing protein [Sphingomonas jejuensis]NJC32959.1 hypothetical protein [Sphingomonas jejuensis]